ncbi:MAG: CrcB family protein [Myxococcales bacterium]|nr:CrcB family protein [Myxococcales bacterium]
MTPAGALAVTLGAAAGALCRALLASTGWRWVGLPLPTLLVNLGGSFLLGVLLGLGPDPRVGPGTRAMVGTGFCGSFTTMSTFAVETLDLPPWIAAANLGANVGGSLLFAALGTWVGRSLRSSG